MAMSVVIFADVIREEEKAKAAKAACEATTDDDRASLEEQLASLASPVTKTNERVETPEDSGPARRSQGGVTCCSFGRNRWEKFPEYFFCHPCDLADNILGSELSPAHWKCPTAAKGKEIGTITMDNGKTRKIIDSLELLIDASIVDNAEKTQWKECIPFYRSAVTRLRSKEDFDTEAIVRFQQDADKFFQTWVTLHGIKGITNYIHMLSSGHMLAYLARWKNLYRYSQQGWKRLTHC